MNKVKAIRVSIFEDKRFGNSSNHGISERWNEILLIHPEGYITVDLDDPQENVCRIVERRLFGDGKIYKHIEPVAEAHGVGWMYGGSLVYSSDARFGNEPLRLHDRTESQELYDMLSR